MRRRPQGCLILIVVLMLVAVGGWLFVRNGPYQQAVNVSPEMAGILDSPEEIVERLRYKDTPYGKVGQYKAALESGETAYFDIDEEKQVVGYFLAGQHAASAVVNEGQAITAARAFALKHFPDAALLNGPPESASLITAQEDARFYQIIWAKRDQATGARLPQSVQVQVNAETGAVTGYQREYLENLPAVVANVTKDSAVAESIQTMQEYFDQPEVVDSDLILTMVPLNDPKGELRTVWYVQVRGKSDLPEVVPEAVILIDAGSGKVIQIIPLE